MKIASELRSSQTVSIFQALVLGVVQGVTEFLPISSSGHLVIFPELLNWPLQDVAFDAVIHLATLLVMLIYFWDDIVEIFKMTKTLRQAQGDKERVIPSEAEGSLLLWMIVLATIPVGLVGLWLEDGGLRTLPVIMISLAFWGVVLMLADRFSEKLRNRIETLKEIKWARALIVGVAQAIALIPGTSRSGITITAGLFSGMDRKLAARFAFLVGIPAIAAAGLKKSLDVANGSVELDLLPLAFGFIAAFVSGYAAVSFLMHIVERVSYKWFGLYRILLASFLFLVWLQSSF